MVLNPEPFDLRYLLDMLQAMFRIRAEAKRLSLTFHLSPDLPGAIVANEGKLRQVLINLLLIVDDEEDVLSVTRMGL